MCNCTTLQKDRGRIHHKDKLLHFFQTKVRNASVMQFHVNLCVSLICLCGCILIPEQLWYWYPFRQIVSDLCVAASLCSTPVLSSFFSVHDSFYSTSGLEIPSEVIAKHTCSPVANPLLESDHHWYFFIWLKNSQNLV